MQKKPVIAKAATEAVSKLAGDCFAEQFGELPLAVTCRFLKRCFTAFSMTGMGSF